MKYLCNRERALHIKRLNHHTQLTLSESQRRRLPCSKEHRLPMSLIKGYIHISRGVPLSDYQYHGKSLALAGKNRLFLSCHTSDDPRTGVISSDSSRGRHMMTHLLQQIRSHFTQHPNWTVQDAIVMMLLILESLQQHDGHCLPFIYSYCLFIDKRLLVALNGHHVSCRSDSHVIG